MKILYVTTISNTVNAFLIPHIKLLIEQGNKVDIAFNTVREVSPELIKLGCKIHEVDFRRSPFNKDNITAYKQIKKIISMEDYDLVHTHTPIASFITRLACRNLSIKIVYTAHGFHFFKGAPLRNWVVYYPIEKIAARYTDEIITINHEDYMVAQKFKMKGENSVSKVHGVGIDLSKFVPANTIEKERLRKTYGLNKDDFILFYAAELNYNKHQDLLINAVNILRETIPSIKLLLAGNGGLKKHYEQQIKSLGLEGNVMLLGFRNDIPELLKISDVSVASSRREGLPVNIMEAMATGIPIVATNIRGHADLIIDGKNGYTTELDDPKGFAKAIEKIYCSQEVREEFKRNNLKIVNKYTLDHVLSEMNDIYIN